MSLPILFRTYFSYFSVFKLQGINIAVLTGKVFSRVPLNRLKDAVDPHLRDHQAGFRKNRSCAHQIATLRSILEQSLEWNSSVYVTFIDYEKAFNIADRGCLWKLLRRYGIPEKITSIIQNSYEGWTSAQWSTHRCLPCANWCETRLSTVAFPVLPCDRLHFEAIHVTKKKWDTMDFPITTGDLDFTDDLALL